GLSNGEDTMRARTILPAAALLVAGTLLGWQTVPGGAATTSAQDRPAATDPLPSWNDGATKRAILEFVAKVTREGGPDFVPVAERIATFDNDGTLWCEMPVYNQFAFAIDRVRALAGKHPEWKTEQPFKAALEGDIKALVATGEKG